MTRRTAALMEDSIVDTQYVAVFDQLREVQEQSPELMDTVHICAEVREENESIAELTRFASEVQEYGASRAYFYSGS